MFVAVVNVFQSVCMTQRLLKIICKGKMVLGSIYDIICELKEANELKELYKEWQNDSKTEKDLAVVKAGLLDFYCKVEETNGFLEGINNNSKVIKRNAYGLKVRTFQGENFI